MSSSTRHSAKILSVLVCLVLIDKAESLAARTEIQKLQGSFNWGRDKIDGGPERKALDEFKIRTSATSATRGLLQARRPAQSQVQSDCGLSSEDVDRFYDASSGQWLLNDDVLKELDNDVQAIVECANENDVLLFATDQIIKPRKTLVLSHNLTIASRSESGSARSGVPVSVSGRVRMTCPDSGQLLISRSSSFALRSLIVEDCNTTSSVIEVDPDCTKERTKGIVQLVDLTIERNELLDEGSIIDAANATCAHLEFNNLLIRSNLCSRPCVLLPISTLITNVQLIRNEATVNSLVDSSIFATSEDSEIIVANITSRRNTLRSFHISRSTLKITDSHFSNNRRNQSSIIRDYSIGGAVIFSNHSSVSVSSTTFEHNFALNGGVLFAWSSNMSISECIFRENEAEEGNGGAVYGHYNSSFNISSSVFSKNQANSGAVLFSNSTLRVDLVNVSVWENNSNRFCSVMIYSGIASIQSSSFLQNIAGQGGAALCTITTHLTVTNSSFISNSASFGGACIFQSNSNILGVGLTFDNNTARATHGGAISILFESGLRLRDSVFQRNRASNDGGAIDAGRSTVGVLTSVQFLDNFSSRYGGSVFILEANFTILNSTFISNRALSFGGAIMVQDCNTLRIDMSEFTANEGSFGGGLRLTRVSNSVVTNCTFEENVAETSGAGLFLLSSTMFFQSVMFFNNSGQFGSSMFLQDFSNATMLECNFVQNRATLNGGALYASTNSTLSLYRGSFSGNVAMIGGAIYLYGSSNASVLGSNFTDHEAGGSGGVVFLIERSMIELSATRLDGNQAEDGGAIFLEDFSSGTVSNSSFTRNRAVYNGGAINIDTNSTLTLDHSTITENQAEEGGSVYLQGFSAMTAYSSTFRNSTASSFGGALALTGGSNLSIVHCFFSSNTLFLDIGWILLGNGAASGGSLYLRDESAASVSDSEFTINLATSNGGTIYSQSSTVAIFSTKFASSNASFGGALYSRNTSLQIKKSTFEGSFATRSGGAIYTGQSNTSLDSTIIHSNHAGVYCGGICAMEGSHLKLQNLTVQSNSAETAGGGIVVANASSVLCYSCNVSHNRALNGAGLYAFSNYSILIVAQLQNSRFEDNSAQSYGGAIELAAPQNSTLNCGDPDVICGHIILLNIEFIANFATHSGAAVQTSNAETVLVSCNQTRNIRDFVDEVFMRSLVSIQPGKLCPSWRRNRVSTNTYGDVVGTYGQKIVLSIAPNEDAVSLSGTTRDGYVLENVSSGRQLPIINVTLVDGFGVGPAPTLPYSFEARLSSPDGFFLGLYPANISAGSGKFSEVAGFARPGNYTLEIGSDNPSLNTLVVVVMVRECIVGEESTRDGLTCQACDAFSYNFNASQVGGCKECPEEATCEGRYIVPEHGHWHKSPCHDTIQRCLVEEACTYEDRRETLMNFTQNSTRCNMNKTALDSYKDALCNEGYKSPLCGSCKKSFGLTMRFLCSKCTSTVLSVLTILGVTLYLLIASSFTIRGGLPSSPKPQNYHPAPVQPVSASDPSNGQTEINVEMVKMVEERHTPKDHIPDGQGASNSQSQTASTSQETKFELTRWKATEILKTTAVASTVAVQWTNGLITFFEGTEHVGALTTIVISRPVDCITSSSSATIKAVWRMLVSLLVPGTVIGILGCVWAYTTLKNKKDMSHFLRRFTLSAIAVTYISYLGLTEMAVMGFYCVSIYDSDDFSANTKVKLWAIDTSIKCFEKDHSSILFIAVTVLSVVSLLFPLVFAIVVFKNKVNHKKRDSQVFETAGFLFRAFKESCLFWESLVMFRKACLSVIVVFSYPLGGDTQGLLASLLLLFCLYLQLTLKPYRKEFKSLNHLESSSLLVSAVTFNLSLFFVNSRSSDPVRTLLATVIILGNSLFFSILLFALFYSLIAHLRVVLQCENISLPDNAPWWQVVRIYASSRSFISVHLPKRYK